MKKTEFSATAFGTSMIPLINPGDIVFFNKVKESDIAVGDIVAFYDGKKLIIHRVIAKEKDKILAKGDNVSAPDSPLEESDILGKVIRIDGKYGVINLEERNVRFFQLYFLFRSLILLNISIFNKLLLRLFFGRRFITKYILAKKQ